MRLGVTPVPIPNTMVKTQTADNTSLETVREDRWLPILWGYSSVGRAPALQAGGHEFESRYLHWSKDQRKIVLSEPHKQSLFRSFDSIKSLTA